MSNAIVSQAFKSLAFVRDQRHVYSTWKLNNRGRNLLRKSLNQGPVWQIKTQIRASEQAILENPPENKKLEIKRAVKFLEDKLLSLEDNFFESLPKDLKSDISESGFSLTSGPVIEVLGSSLGPSVAEAGTSLESLNTSAFKTHLKEVSKGALQLEDGSLQQFFLGERLISASGSLIFTGEQKLVKLGNAIKSLGEWLKFGLDESLFKDLAPEVPPSKSLKFGDLQLDLTANNAFIGAAIAFSSSLVFYKFASGLELDSTKFPSQSASTVAESLFGAVYFVTYGSSVLSVLTAVSLLVLGIQLS